MRFNTAFAVSTTRSGVNPNSRIRTSLVLMPKSFDADTRTVEAGVALPSERGCCLDAHTRSDSRWQYRVAIGLRLRVEQFPAGH